MMTEFKFFGVNYPFITTKTFRISDDMAFRIWYYVLLPSIMFLITYKSNESHKYSFTSTQLRHQNIQVHTNCSSVKVPIIYNNIIVCLFVKCHLFTSVLSQKYNKTIQWKNIKVTIQLKMIKQPICVYFWACVSLVDWSCCSYLRM